MTNILIADTETNGFLTRSDLKLHMIQLGDADGGPITIYSDDPCAASMGLDAGLERPVLPLVAGLERIAAADKVVFHNGIGYDWDVFERLAPGYLRMEQLLDTLVMARLGFPQERNHTLRAWGQRLGVPKDEYKGDYQAIDPEFLGYSQQDISAGRKLFHHVKHVLDWGRSCEIEHGVQWALIAQERNGFPFDVKKAEEIVATLRQEELVMAAELAKVFPPLLRQEWIVPKVNNKTRGYVKGVRCIAKEYMEPFNPTSRAHIAERLIAAGWKPKAYGDSGAPTVDEAVLASLSHIPEAAILNRYFKVSKTIGTLSDGKAGYLKLVKEDGRMHGRVNGNGARTGRMTHSSPNTANVDKDKRIRGLFGPRHGWKLVGCDGEGIQLRIVSHYTYKYDGGVLAKSIVEGNSADGTDPHSRNMKALHPLGLISRDGAKTCLYAKLFGSTPGGLAYTFKDACIKAKVKPLFKGGHYPLGEAVNNALATAMYGLKQVEEQSGKRAKAVGYLVGLDGRKLYCDQARLSLVTLCQGGEAAIMKLALINFRRRYANSEGLFWALCANVHDEVQFEAHPDWADELGQSFADAITEAGVQLGVRCHMAGKYSVGNNWSETH